MARATSKTKERFEQQPRFLRIGLRITRGQANDGGFFWREDAKHKNTNKTQLLAS
jgi:hypothetical protein